MDTSDRPGRATVVDTPNGPTTPEAVRAAVVARLTEGTDWEQGAWAFWQGREAPAPGCGTAHCAAGWACVEAGYELEWVADIEHDPPIWWATRVLIPGGAEPIADVAAVLLGLSYDQSSYLFDGARTLEEITDCFAALDRGETPDIADDPAPF